MPKKVIREGGREGGRDGGMRAWGRGEGERGMVKLHAK